jgi:Recombination endonuclease VII
LRDPGQYNRRTKEQAKRHRETFRERAGSRLKELQRKWGLKHAYGIDVETYERLYNKQNGLCAICKKSEVARLRGVVKRLSVDHCHKTGKVRGLLCTACNSVLGHAFDDPEVLRSAIAYLQGHTPKSSEASLDDGHGTSV